MANVTMPIDQISGPVQTLDGSLPIQIQISELQQRSMHVR
jgi:hypothetical protein